MRAARLIAIVLAAIAFPVKAAAGPITIEVIETTYRTFVRVGGAFRETIASDPISDAILVPVPPAPFPLPISSSLQAGGIADAGLFSISLEAIATPWDPISAVAIAESNVRFSPVQDGFGTIGLTASSIMLWTEASVGLFNVTANQQIWSYGWDYALPIETDPSTFWDRSPLSLTTYFSASEDYELRLYGRASSNHEGELPVRIGVSGLQTVPEPSSLALALIGLGTSGAAYRRWRRDGR